MTVKDALGAAIQNETKLAGDAAEKRSDLQNRTQARADLIDQAATGANIKTADLLAAEGKIREAEAAHALATAILAGATTAKHRAEVAVWADEAEALLANIDNAVGARIEAARRLHHAMATAQLALADYDATGQEVMSLQNKIRVFNFAAADRNATNPVHAALTHPPHVNHRYVAPVQKLKITLYAPLGWGEPDPVSITDLTAFETAAWGVLPVETAAAA